MNKLYNVLPRDEIDRDEGIVTFGDSVLSQFYYGNYIDAVNMLRSSCVSADTLAEYLEDQAEELDMDIKDMYNGHFTLSLFASIGASVG